MKRVCSLWFVVYSLVLSSLLISSNCYAQSEIKLVREGNKQYKNKKYSDAEASYTKSLKVNKESKTAQFNLGDALYRQNKYDEAIRLLQQLSFNKQLTVSEKADVFHNLGNSYFKVYFSNDSVLKNIDGQIAELKDVPGRDISERVKDFVLRDSLQKQQDIIIPRLDSALNSTIESYKKSLRLASGYEETRYNLAYAQKLIKENEKRNNKNKKDKEKKDPTPFAVGIKKKADDLVSQRKYDQAYVLLNEGLQKDSTVENFKDYITKIKDVVVINKLK